MDPSVMIRVENISKKYGRSVKQAMFYGLQDIGRNVLGLSAHGERLRLGEFWAVQNVSFEVKRGETLGLIGPNGSGKTTIMKMLNGIFWPDKGRIAMRGRVGALIAVGSGFHPVLTGMENIFLNGAILGMRRREMRKKFDAIVDFAGIGDFLNMPVKHYSSGMYVRLGFAIAIHCEPDILLVDEILAVGDIDFRLKCVKKMKELENKGITKVFVSHDLNSVHLLCDKTMYISNGRVKDYGPTADAIGKYKKDMDEQAHAQQPVRPSVRITTGAQNVIREVQFLNKQGESKTSFKRGERMRIRILFQPGNNADHLRFSITFYNDWDILLSKQATAASDGLSMDYVIDSVPFNIGKYTVSIECTDASGRISLDRHEKCYAFIVEEGLVHEKIQERGGLTYAPCHWTVLNQGRSNLVT